MGHAPHALEIQGPQGDVKTNVLQGGNSATLTASLTKPGRYTWYCPVGDHRQEGMVGKITVASAGGASAGDKESSQGGGSSSGY